MQDLMLIPGAAFPPFYPSKAFHQMMGKEIRLYEQGVDRDTLPPEHSSSPRGGSPRDRSHPASDDSAGRRGASSPIKGGWSREVQYTRPFEVTILIP